MANLHFAQISDIHISDSNGSKDSLSGQAATFLAAIVARLNQIDDLDFVLISGDLFNSGSHTEFKKFQHIISTLKKTVYIIPGNHDRQDANQSQGLTRHQFARHFNPQIESRPTRPEAQVGYWSHKIAPQAQLIGLDSTKDDDWGGIVDAQQIEWLKHELHRNVNKLVILTVHHPLHPLAPIDYLPYWGRFVCSNGPEILALLDKHPQVKVVLTGHHHITKVDRREDCLHLACPAIVSYPCAYRTLRLQQQKSQQWQLDWKTHPVTDELTLAQAQTRMFNGWISREFDTADVEEYISIAHGTPYDRNGTALL